MAGAAEPHAQGVQKDLGKKWENHTNTNTHNCNRLGAAISPFLIYHRHLSSYADYGEILRADAEEMILEECEAHDECSVTSAILGRFGGRSLLCTGGVLFGGGVPLEPWFPK